MRIELPSDEELASLCAKGDKEAVDCLLDRYKPLVRHKARAYFLYGGDSDDLIQEGMIGLYKAIRDYKDNKGSAFRTFAELCITRQLLTAIKASSRQKHQPLNSYISFDSLEQSILIADDPEQQLIHSEKSKELNSYIQRALSKLERSILSAYLEGLTYSEIAAELGKNAKAIDNAIQRIRRKLRAWGSDGMGACVH